MNKQTYQSAMERLPFDQNFESSVIANMEAGKKPKPVSGFDKIPGAVRKAAEFAAAAACLAILSLFVFPLFHNNSFKLPHSSGNVAVRVVKNPDLDGQSIPQPADLSEEEQFKRADTIFSGTVKEIKTLEISLGGDVSYRSLITVSVGNVWRGTAHAGSTVKILLPYAVDESKDGDTVLSRIRTGMRGIFLTENYTKDSLDTSGDNALALIDLAPYGLPDDSCAFLDKDSGIVYRAASFPGLKMNPTYDEVCGYIDTMLSKDQATTTEPKNDTTAADDTTPVVTKPNGSSGKSGNSSDSKPADDSNKDSGCDYIWDRATRGHYFRIAKDGTKKIYDLPMPWDTLSCDHIETDSEWIYFELKWNTGNGGLYRCRRDGSEFKKIYNGNCPFTLNGNSIILRDQDTYYKMDKDGSDLSKIRYLMSGNETENILTDKNAAYVFRGDELLKVSLSDGSFTSLHKFSSSASRLTVAKDDSSIYFCENGSTLKKIGINGTKETTVAAADGEIRDVQICRGYAYYLLSPENPDNNTAETGASLYRVPTDASAKPKLIRSPNAKEGNSVAGIQISNSHLYVWYDDSLYRMNLDGSSPTKIN